MKNNLKNKILSAIALLFAFALTTNNASFAADEPLKQVKPVAEANEAVAKVAQKADNAVAEAKDAAADAENKAEENIKAIDAEIASVKEELSAINEEIGQNIKDEDPTKVDSDIDVLNEEPSEAEVAPKDDKNPIESDTKAENGNAQGEKDVFADVSDDDIGKSVENEKLESAEAPKSPLESFGNSILSKVDNNLFNKMSDIEKQTTLLRLEYKREELKNKVAALRTARLRAMEEEAERKRAMEDKVKDAEAQRQAKIIEEQRKLEERKIELEKLRQAKVLNEYMNEMLLENQKWVENNAKLQGRINELQEERDVIIKKFKADLDDLVKEINKTNEHIVLVVKDHFDNLSALKDKISRLEDKIRRKDEQIRSLKETVENPFNEDAEDLTQSDIDLSQEYAIMDITGQGDQVVAKLVSQDGTTFSVHKGSMLKNGEVVTAITDTYISFDKKGVKSYLYTGGTIREYEPKATFKGSSEDFFEPIAIPAKAATPAQTPADVKANAQKNAAQKVQTPKASNSNITVSAGGTFVK